jgi:hypothetical protein
MRSSPAVGQQRVEGSCITRRDRRQYSPFKPAPPVARFRRGSRITNNRGSCRQAASMANVADRGNSRRIPDNLRRYFSTTEPFSENDENRPICVAPTRPRKSYVFRHRVLRTGYPSVSPDTAPARRWTRKWTWRRRVKPTFSVIRLRVPDSPAINLVWSRVWLRGGQPFATSSTCIRTERGWSTERSFAVQA